MLSWRYFQIDAYHHQGYRTSSMSRCHAKHQIAFVHATMEKETGKEGCNGFSQRAEDTDARHYQYGISSFEQQSRIDQHTYTYQEIGNKDGIADKLNAIHQWRDVRDKAIEHQSGDECSEYALQSYQFAGRRTDKHHCKHEDILHHRVGISSEKPARHVAYKPCHCYTPHHKLDEKHHPEERPRIAGHTSHQCRCHHKGNEKRQH